MSLEICNSPDLPDLLAADVAERPAERSWRGEFSPQMVYGRHDGPPRASARRAAVAILLCETPRGWTIPLTLRPESLPRHAGQVSFPGGLLEAGETPRDAALREVEEELGVRPALRWLGELAEVFVFASDTVMVPCLAAVEGEPTWRPNASEVASVLPLELAALAGEDLPGPLLIERGPIRFRAPQFLVEGRPIWGATAVVLGELRGRLRLIAGAIG